MTDLRSPVRDRAVSPRLRRGRICVAKARSTILIHANRHSKPCVLRAVAPMNGVRRMSFLERDPIEPESEPAASLGVLVYHILRHIYGKCRAVLIPFDGRNRRGRDRCAAAVVLARNLLYCCFKLNCTCSSMVKTIHIFSCSNYA